jgi:hypothetical protein
VLEQLDGIGPAQHRIEEPAVLVGVHPRDDVGVGAAHRVQVQRDPDGR